MCEKEKDESEFQNDCMACCVGLTTTRRDVKDIPSNHDIAPVMVVCVGCVPCVDFEHSQEQNSQEQLNIKEQGCVLCAVCSLWSPFTTHHCRRGRLRRY